MCASVVSLPFQLAGLAMIIYGTWNIWAKALQNLPDPDTHCAIP